MPSSMGCSQRAGYSDSAEPVRSIPTVGKPTNVRSHHGHKGKNPHAVEFAGEERQGTGREIYREVILDHYRNPRRRGALTGDHIHAEGQNPSCGDEFSLDIAVDSVTARSSMQPFRVRVASISQASGSMMAAAIVGKSLAQING